MQVPYELATLITPDSYLGLQLISATISTCGALLMVALTTRLGYDFRYGLTAGSIYAVFGADSSKLFLGMSVVELAICFVLLAAVIHFRRGYRGVGRSVAVIGLQTLGLLTYDVVVALILALGLLLMHRQRMRQSLIWVAVPIAWSLTQVWRYGIEQDSSYQSDKIVISEPVETAVRLGDLVYRLFAVPKWLERSALQLSPVELSIAVLAAVMSAIILMVIASRPNNSRGRDPASRNHRLRKTAALLALATFVCVTPYVLIDNAFYDFAGTASPWRSLLMASVPASLLLMLGIAFAARWNRVLGTFVLAGLLAAGLVSNLGDQRVFIDKWDTYRDLTTSIKTALPGVQDGSLVVLQDTSGSEFVDTVFESSIWSNATAQLLFPATRVVMTYRSQDGTWAPDMTLAGYPESTRITSSAVGVEAEQFGPQQVVTLTLDNGGVLTDVGTFQPVDGAQFLTGATPNVRCAPDTAVPGNPLLGELDMPAQRCSN